MIGNAIRGLLAVLLLAGLPPAMAQTPARAAVPAMSAEAEEAAKVVDQFHASLARNDVPGALVLLADDALIFEGGNAERSKAEYASHHASADAAYASAVPSSLLRRRGVADATTAWIASETRAVGRYKDKAVSRLSTETMVLRRTPLGWQISHIHWSSRNAP